MSYSAKTEEEEATVPEEEEAESESELPTVPYLVDSYLATVPEEEEAEEVEELGTNDWPSGYYEGEEEAVHREVQSLT